MNKKIEYDIDKLIVVCSEVGGNCKACLQQDKCNKFCKEIEYYLEEKSKPNELAWIESERMKQILYK